MRIIHTQSRKARRKNDITAFSKFPYNASVLMRRVNGIYGADSREFDKRHPRLEDAAEGIRKRLAK